MTDERCFASATWIAERDSGAGAVVARDRGRLPRPHRRRSTRGSTRSSASPTDARERGARARTRSWRGGRRAGPLHGVPFTIKDSLDTAGVVTTAGTVGWRDRVPDARRDRRRAPAGGRRDPARQDEHARVHLVGRDRQRRLRPDLEPVRPRRGRPAAAAADAAAIVAAGGSPFDIGSDTGDSIRQPAHVCGIAGIKPTSGRVPRTGPLARVPGALRVASRSWARWRAGSRTSRSSCRSSRGRTARIRTSPRCRSGDPSRGRGRGPAGRHVRRQRDPDADARDRRRRRGGGARRSPAAGARVEERAAARPRRGLGRLGRASSAPTGSPGSGA